MRTLDTRDVPIPKAAEAALVDNLNQWKHGFSVKAINSELGKRGHNARLEKANGYFYFKGGEADSINRTTERDTFGP